MATAHPITETEFFREIREKQGYYVDKTSFLTEFFQGNPPKASLFTRPRRFGKTMAMTMLRDFLDIRQDSRSLFEGLEIMKHPDICETWMNQCPVVFLTLKKMKGENFQESFSFCSSLIGNLVSKNFFLKESSRVSERDKRLLALLEDSRDKALLADSLQIL